MATDKTGYLIIWKWFFFLDFSKSLRYKSRYNVKIYRPDVIWREKLIQECHYLFILISRIGLCQAENICRARKLFFVEENIHVYPKKLKSGWNSFSFPFRFFLRTGVTVHKLNHGKLSITRWRWNAGTGLNCRFRL